MSASDQITPKRGRFSISVPRPVRIFAAMVVLIVVAIALQFGLPVYRQQAAIREIERAGGSVQTIHRGPNWLRGQIGEERMKLLDEAVDVRLDDTEATDYTLSQVGVPTSLQRLSTRNNLHLTGKAPSTPTPTPPPPPSL